MKNILDYERSLPHQPSFTMAGLWHTMALIGLIVMFLCCIYQTADSGRRTNMKVVAVGDIAGLMGWFGWCVCLIWRRQMGDSFRMLGYLLAFVTLFFLCIPQYR